jgi:hypothetical protein
MLSISFEQTDVFGSFRCSGTHQSNLCGRIAMWLWLKDRLDWLPYILERIGIFDLMQSPFKLIIILIIVAVIFYFLFFRK